MLQSPNNHYESKKNCKSYQFSKPSRRADKLQLAPTGNRRIFGQLMILAERSIISVSQYLAEKILRNLRNYTFVYILVFTEESEE